MRLLLPLLAGFLVACGLGAERTEGPPDELDIDVSQRGLIDCSERTDTGYVDGNPFAITVVTVDGKPVERDTANAYWVMQQAAELDGVQISVVSGFRTYEQQQYLYDCYVNCNCNNCNLAAPPGYSNHQSGHALDLNTSSPGVYQWLDANGAAFGFTMTVPSEDWHWEWWGGGPGGGPCLGCNASCDGTVMTLPDCSTEDCALGEGTCVDDTFDVRCEPRCDALPPEGGVIDETGSCFNAFGPNQFWRSVEDAGYGGGLLWTNAFESDEPSNWARWNIELSEPGEYELEVYLDPAWAVYAEARYEVHHDGGDTVVMIDQSAAVGWASLGPFAMSSGASVSVFDDAPGPVAADQHIAVDAVRLTRVREDLPEKPDDPARVRARWSLPPAERSDARQISLPMLDPNPEPMADPVAEASVDGGCSCTATSFRVHTSLAMFLLLPALILRPKRGSRRVSGSDGSSRVP